MQQPKKPITTSKLRKMKQDREPITMITAYDYPSAYLAEEAGIDMILVGDSLGNVVLGYETTLPVTIDDMIYHTKAVTRAVKHTFVVTDMPFLTYHGSIDNTLRHAGRIMQEGGAKAVKMEGGAEIVPAIEALTRAGVPVMGHIGLTPQSIYQIGGYKVQGKTNEQAQKLLEEAKALEAAGVFTIVLELATDDVASLIAKEISVPIIGIGAGASCDGQVLVFHDVFQYGPAMAPKRFVKTYGDVGQVVKQGIEQYIKEVKERSFPAPEHGFYRTEEAIGNLYGSK